MALPFSRRWVFQREGLNRSLHFTNIGCIMSFYTSNFAQMHAVLYNMTCSGL